MGSLDNVGESLLRRVLQERVPVTAFLQTLVRRQDLAEDLFQDLCVLVLQKQAEVEQVVNLGSWLRTAGRNLAQNALRKRSNDDLSRDLTVQSMIEPHWEQFDETTTSELGDALEGCIQHLGSGARQLVYSRYVEGFKLTDLAQRLNRPASSLYVAMGRIHKKLAECIQRKIARGEGSANA